MNRDQLEEINALMAHLDRVRYYLVSLNQTKQIAAEYRVPDVRTLEVWSSVNAMVSIQDDDDELGFIEVFQKLGKAAIKLFRQEEAKTLRLLSKLGVCPDSDDSDDDNTAKPTPRARPRNSDGDGKRNIQVGD